MTLNLSDLSGTLLGSTTLAIAANAQISKFLNEIFVGSALPQSLQGMLEIKASSPGIAAAGLRGRYNERSDFLITTTPMVDENAPIAGANTFHILPMAVVTRPSLFYSVAQRGSPRSGSLVFSGQDGNSLSITLHK